MGLVKTSKDAVAERRQSERRRVLLGSWIVSLDGNQIAKCGVIDISAAGARIHIDGPLPIPSSIYFLEMRNRLVYESRVVWRSGQDLGLEFLRVYRFAELPSAKLISVIENVFGLSLRG